MWRIFSIILILVSFISTPSYAGKYNSILSIGDSMPGFKDLPSISGKTLSSSDLKSDVVVMVSLANHCPWVRGMDPELVALTKQFKNQSVDFVGVSVNHREDDRLPAMQQHAKKTGYTFDYVYDESQQLGRQLGATRTPEYFVFNKQRKLIYMGLLTNSPAQQGMSGKIKHINGKPSIFYVSDAINAALQGKVAPIAETRAHGCSVKYEQ